MVSFNQMEAHKTLMHKLSIYTIQVKLNTILIFLKWKKIIKIYEIWMKKTKPSVILLLPGEKQITTEILG